MAKLKCHSCSSANRPADHAARNCPTPTPMSSLFEGGRKYELDNVSRILKTSAKSGQEKQSKVRTTERHEQRSDRHEKHTEQMTLRFRDASTRLRQMDKASAPSVESQLDSFMTLAPPSDGDLKSNAGPSEKGGEMELDHDAYNEDSNGTVW